MLTDNEKRRQNNNNNNNNNKTRVMERKKLEWQIHFLIIIYTVLQIYNVYGDGCLRRYRRGNLHHYSVRDYTHSS